MSLLRGLSRVWGNSYARFLGGWGGGNAPRLPDQLIESKARFIEQALAGEITARTVEDTSEVVLSAAEIKAIASGNPQIVRKVQLEAEVARLERVRSVWLDTRRNLQVERHFVEEEIHRLEGRCRQWEQAEQLVSAHPHDPFRADVRSGMSGEALKACTERQEAGSAVRKLVHEYQSAAAFQRQRLRGVIAHYRGLHLVVQAYAVFAADLSLALPDGTTLDTVTASTDAGVWQSVGHTVNEIPATLQRLHGRIKQAFERIATIDSELARLEQWDGQQSYDAAASELSAINAIFAAEEERASAERSAAPVEGTVPVEEVASDEESLGNVLLALAMQDHASGEWDDQPSIIPPAPESLAHLATELERREIAPVPPVSSQEDERAVGQLEAPASVGLYRVQSKASVRFGDHAAPKRGARTPASSEQEHEEVVEQLSLMFTL